MMNQLSIDFEAARAGRDAGMQAATEHADAVFENWSEHAYSMLLQYLRETRMFMTEDVRAYAQSRGLPSPPDGRAWGGVITRAAKANLIERIGFAPMKSPNCHMNPKSVWQRKAVPTK